MGDWQAGENCAELCSLGIRVNYQDEVWRGSYTPFGGFEVRRELCRIVKLGELGTLILGDRQSQENYPELCSLERQLPSLCGGHAVSRELCSLESQLHSLCWTGSQQGTVQNCAFKTTK